MYCVCDSNNRVIAFHDDYDVVETYVHHVVTSHKDGLVDLHIRKIKKKKAKKLEDYNDLYLVRYAHTYVQNGYIIFLEMFSSQIIEDNQYCRDVLLRILEHDNLEEKDIKHIKKAIKVVDRILEESKQYTPSYEELKSYEDDYYPYLYNKGVF